MLEAELPDRKTPSRMCVRGMLAASHCGGSMLVSGLLRNALRINAWREWFVRASAAYPWPDRDMTGSEIRDIAEFQLIIFTKTDRSSNKQELWLA